MMQNLFVSLVFLVSFPIAAFAQNQETAAEKLAQALDIQKEITRVQHEVFEPQISREPKLAQYKLVIEPFYARYMSYEANKARILKILSSEFTEEEMAEIARFYSSPTGQKASKLLFPTVGKITQLIYSQGHEHISDLKQMLKDELSDVSPDMDLSGHGR